MRKIKSLVALLLLLLLATAPCFSQTLGYTNWTGVSSGTTATTTAGTTQATGSTFVVLAYSNAGSGAQAPTSIVDNKGNTYTQAQTVSQYNGELAAYYCINCVGGAGHTITGTWANAGGLSLALVEFKAFGAATFHTAPTGTTNTGASPITAPSITTTAANELVVDLFSTYNANTQTITDSGSGFSIILSQQTSSFVDGAISTAQPASSGTAAADVFAYSGFDYTLALALSFRPAGAPGAPSPKMFLVQ